MMLCSTIIPTVNRPSLERAVMSVLDQGLGPDLHEIIVINDSGQQLPRLEWLQSLHIQVINTNRCERSVARNVGAAAATGKYLHFLDDDDYLLPGGLQALLKAAESSDGSWVYGSLRLIDRDGEYVCHCPQDIQGNIFGYLVAGENIHFGSSLIKREAFLSVGGFDPGLVVGEDRDLGCRLALVSNVHRIGQAVVCISIGPEGSTTDRASASQQSHVIREKALSSPCAFARMLDSVRGDAHIRGCCCRMYLFSAILNLLAGHFSISLNRMLTLLRLAGAHTLLPTFWRGALSSSFRYDVERRHWAELHAVRHHH